jgi:hypothetical protein
MGFTTINGFEDGTVGHFATVVGADTNSAVSFPHYTELARTPGLAMPYRGAYCMKVDLATASTAGGWIQDDANWDVTTATEDIYIRMKFWLSKDAAMSSDDVFDLIHLASGADITPITDGVGQALASIKYTTAAGWELGIGKIAPTSLTPLTLGEWHDLEMYFNPASGTGTIDAWLDGTALTQVTTLTSLTTTSGAIGAVPGAAFTPTAGTLLIDEVIGSQTDDTSARIGSQGERFPEQLSMYGSGHAFVGSGVIDNVSLIAALGQTDGTLTLYDTDRADTVNGSRKLVLRAVTSGEAPVDPAGMPITITKGCYVSFSGTDAENISAILDIHRAVGYGSDGAIRNHAFRQ